MSAPAIRDAAPPEPASERRPFVPLLAVLLAVGAVLAGCQSRPAGGLEGRTLDTPRRAFAYFQDAVRLERYDLEYEVYSEEFIEENGGFSLQDYVRGRPWATGEQAELLENLLEAEVVEEDYSDGGRRVWLVLASDDFRGEVLLVRRTHWRIGVRITDPAFDEPFEETFEDTLDDLAGLVSVDGEEIGLRLPVVGSFAVIGLDPPRAGEITRVEAAHRWYLRAVGRVERQEPGAR